MRILRKVYLCICGALYKLNRKERIPDTFMLQVLETINLDLIRVSRMQGKKSVAYLFPLNYDGYLDNIIKNIHLRIPLMQQMFIMLLVETELTIGVSTLH